MLYWHRKEEDPKDHHEDNSSLATRLVLNRTGSSTTLVPKGNGYSLVPAQLPVSPVLSASPAPSASPALTENYKATANCRSYCQLLNLLLTTENADNNIFYSILFFIRTNFLLVRSNFLFTLSSLLVRSNFSFILSSLLVRSIFLFFLIDLIGLLNIYYKSFIIVFIFMPSSV